jgi:hypothetical protein
MTYATEVSRAELFVEQECSNIPWSSADLFCRGTLEILGEAQVNRTSTFSFWRSFDCNLRINFAVSGED